MKKDQTPNKLYQTALAYIQIPGLRDVDLEPRHNTGSYKINMLRQRRKNTREKKSNHTPWTHKPEPSIYRARLETQW